MTIKKLIVCGDLHLHKIGNEPRHSQVMDFLHWLFYDSGLNATENELLLLGDLVETIDDPSELLEVYIDLFLNHSNFNHIYILKGNHDENMVSSFTSALRPLHNVEIIEIYTEKNIDGLKCLFLPYYDHTKNKDIPMYEKYSNPSTMKSYVENSIPYDYVFHHVEDEQNHYSSKYCDLSWIKTNNWLCGHIHTENITQGGRILGAPIFNSSTEKNKTPYIASIDLQTKKYELIKVPIFLSYHEVNYPEELTVPITKYALWTVNESIDKTETIKYYTKQATEKGFTFYPLRINSKRNTKKLIDSTNTNSKRKSYTETFSLYATDNNIDKSIIDICMPILKNREDK